MCDVKKVDNYIAGRRDLIFHRVTGRKHGKDVTVHICGNTAPEPVYLLRRFFDDPNYTLVQLTVLSDEEMLKLSKEIDDLTRLLRETVTMRANTGNICFEVVDREKDVYADRLVLLNGRLRDSIRY